MRVASQIWQVVFVSQTLHVFCLAFRKKAQYVVVKKHILGRTIARIYVVEFQKRGLPHAHILIFFTEDCKPHTIEDTN
jgi:hypothetical protein